jgi:hypothetical protein
MRYQKIESKIWNDEKFIRLSPMQQRLFLYMLTCPHGNIIGLFVLKKGYIIEDLNYLSKDLEKDIESISESKLIYFDKGTQTVFIKNFLKHNPITNPNQLKAAIKTISDLPKSQLLQKFLIHNKVLAEALPQVLLKPDTDSYTDTDSETNSETETEVPPLPKAEVVITTKRSNGFDSFWEAYPKKKSKGAALRAWDKARSAKDFPGIEKILAAINQQKTEIDWLKDNGQYIPHPSTWINACGWENEPTRVQSMGQRTLSNLRNAWEFANE